MVAEKARLGAASAQIRNSNPQITLPVFSGDNFFRWQYPKEASKPEGEGAGGGGAAAEESEGGSFGGPSGSTVDEGGELSGPPNSTPPPGEQEQAGGSGGTSFKFLNQTRLSRINLVLDYMRKHRVTKGITDISKVGVTWYCHVTVV